MKANATPEVKKINFATYARKAFLVVKEKIGLELSKKPVTTA